MTADSLSAHDRRTLLVGAGIIAALLLVSRGVPAWVRWQRHVRDAAVATTGEAAASQRTVREAPMATRMAQQLEQRDFAMTPAFVPGDLPTVAGAALIAAVNAAAQSAGLQLGALQVEADTTDSQDVMPVRVRGDGSGDIAGVSRFLATLEGGVPLLAIRELSLTPTDPHGASEKPETIQASFVVEGLVRYDDPLDDPPGAD